MYGVDIKKKLGTRPSSGSGKTEKKWVSALILYSKLS
jgi:hypothetical protein